MLYYLMNSPIYEVFCLAAAILAGTIFLIHTSADKLHQMWTKGKRHRSGEWY